MTVESEEAAALAVLANIAIEIDLSPTGALLFYTRVTTFKFLTFTPSKVWGAQLLFHTSSLWTSVLGATQVQKENGQKSLLDVYAAQVVEMLLTMLWKEGPGQETSLISRMQQKTRAAMSTIIRSHVNTLKDSQDIETSRTTQEGSVTIVLESQPG
ncbi:hypothetical protein BT69DRAFT_1291903 [Atractiella rhizophila]|nr:hypothetical protein BT69DRAFT_1291903 [Atractiella rhizophila]